MGQPVGDVSSDDRLWAALAYAISPIVPVIIFLMEDKKSRPFIKAHNAQALVAGIAVAVLSSIVASFTCGAGFVLWLVQLYWAYQAYQGKTINIPVVSDFVKNQGWA